MVLLSTIKLALKIEDRLKMNPHIWNAENYFDNSSVQYIAASELLADFLLKGNEKILDVGCGDGKITAKIANDVSDGSVLGIDISKEMINFAKKKYSGDKFKNLSFMVKDAQNLDFCDEFDIIFSSFALQWLPDINSFLKKANISLKDKGYLIATIPLGISTSLMQAINKTISSNEWSSYFKTFSPQWNFPEQAKLKKNIISNKFDLIKFDLIFQKITFSSRKEFENYIMPWFSYIQILPEDLKPVFLDNIIKAYFKLEPMLSNGNILFCFPRLDIIAKKTNL